MKILKQVGVVIIGRNEGQRLKKCLTSVLDKVACIVYVDSGSTDDSVEVAKSLGVDVVELDLSIPFTAARARNEGFHHLLALNQQIKFVQFVDGDCEVVEGWLDFAHYELETQPQIAVVCGRRRESFPDKSIYNKLCDIEWNTPIGETKMCGGDSMMRVEAFTQVDGFNASLIAGEEPELCVRLRQQGWKIVRVDSDMTLHDAQMTHFNQWWKRSLRAGHAYAEGLCLHGHSPDHFCIKESRSMLLWGLLVPLLAFGMIGLTSGISLLLFIIYPLIIYRSYCHTLKQGFNVQDSLLYAISCVLSKFPGAQGQIKFYTNRLLGRASQLVEYK